MHEGATEKGDVRNSASLAAILAVKKTPLTLPHCHPIPIEGCNVEWKDVENGLKCIVTVSTTSKTGVEMEADRYHRIALRIEQRWCWCDRIIYRNCEASK